MLGAYTMILSNTQEPPQKGAVPWKENRQTWRRNTPTFTVQMVNQPMARRLDATLAQHSWSKNPYIKSIRLNGAEIDLYKKADGEWKTKKLPIRRASMRSEREETLDCLTRAMIYRADYDPDAPFLFEVKASAEELARMIGQCHDYEEGYDGEDGQYRHGRVAYDCVLAALQDMAAAELIILVHEFDSETKTHKAMRIFFTPKLFKSLGFTMKDTKQMLTASRKYQEKKGLIKTAKQKRQAELLRQSKAERLATLNRPSLKNMLARFKREFTGSNKHTEEVMEAHRRVKEAEKAASEQRKQPERNETELKLMKLRARLAPVHVFMAEKTVKQQYGLEFGDEFNERLLALLQTYV